MKTLSILPVDLRKACPEVAAQRLKDRTFIRGLPSEVCFSFREAQQLLRKHPFSYDVILSTYTFEELLPSEDIIPSSRGHYGSACYHVSKILADNPFATLVLWTGASPRDIALTSEIRERVTVFNRNSQQLLGGVVGGTDTEMANLRATVTDALTEFSLTLTDKDEIAIMGICNRAPISLVPGAARIVLPVRPCLRRVFHSLEEAIAEFQALVNTKGVSARRLELFLRSHPYVLLGNRYKSARWQVHLKRTEEHKGALIPDVLLEPISTSDHWKIQALKAPETKLTRSIPQDGQGFSSQVLAALNQLREYRDYFANPLYRRQLADLGLPACKPEISLVIGRDYGGLSAEEIIKTKGDFGQLEIMTYSELIERVRNGMMWMAGAIESTLGSLGDPNSGADDENT